MADEPLVAPVDQSDRLGHHLNALLSCRRPGLQAKVSERLRLYVEAEARSMSAEAFTRFMNDLNRRIFDLVNSSDTREKMCGIMVIDDLIDVQYEENETKIIRFANYLRMVFQHPSADRAILDRAAKALGHLARAGGTLTADFVEFEVKRALEWLQGEREEHRRHAAVLVLNELAKNSPTLFNPHVATFLDHIWVALRDPKPSIRESAIEALRSVLELIGRRPSRVRAQWLVKLYTEAVKGFGSSNADTVHGSLLTSMELLDGGSEFMDSRFSDLCATVLHFRQHRHHLIRDTVVSSLPRLAHYSPTLFASSYLETTLDHLIAILQEGSQHEVALDALGRLALVLGSGVQSRLDLIVPLVEADIDTRGAGSQMVCLSALECVGRMTRALGSAMRPYVSSLVETIFRVPGLPPAMIQALVDLSDHFDDLVQPIQSRLLALLTSILTHDAKLPDQGLESWSGSSPSPHLLVELALHTLATFRFDHPQMLQFVQVVVVRYLDHGQPLIRREAVQACSHTLQLHLEKRGSPRAQTTLDSVSSVLDRLLQVALADSDPQIRQVVLSSLPPCFDVVLAQAHHLKALFMALNDERFESRQLAMSLVGRLAPRNPACVLPSLRKTLIQLLTELQFSTDSVQREESSALLGSLVTTTQTLIQPYVVPVLNVLLPKLQDPDPVVSCGVLDTLGKLAQVGGTEILPHLDRLLPLIVDMLAERTSSATREVALRTLGDLVQSTGQVIQPYLQYPRLLPLILQTLQSDQSWAARKQAIRALGILGALDPYNQKGRLALAASPASLASEDESSTPITPTLSITSEQYFPTVAIRALIRILGQPRLSQHHNMVISAIMFIFKSLGLQCVPFLDQIVPPFLHVLQQCEDSLRDALFQQLSVLVQIVQHNIRPYLEGILDVVHQYWHDSSLLPSILALVEELTQALQDEFQVYLPDLIPPLVSLLQTETAPTASFTLQVVHALETLVPLLDDYLYLVVPGLLRLCQPFDAPVKVRVAAIHALGWLGRNPSCSSYLPRLVHPLARLLDEAVPGLHEPVFLALARLIYHQGSALVVFLPLIQHKITQNRLEGAAKGYRRLAHRLVQTGRPGSWSQFQQDVGEKSSTPSQPHTSSSSVKQLHVSQANLKKAWEASQRSTRDDWNEWMRRVSVELLKESPSPALRSCSALAQKYNPLARELFQAAFVSCWTQLHDSYQDDLVHHLLMAFRSPHLPPDIAQMLLSLAEFLERHRCSLNVATRTLGEVAARCHAYAKALRYKEMEFAQAPDATLEDLISINHQLNQSEAAEGLLDFAQRHFQVALQQSWLEKLNRWEDALEAYERRQLEEPTNAQLTLGRMRCLEALGEWGRLARISARLWDQEQNNGRVLAQIAPLGCVAAWHLDQWQQMPQYLVGFPTDSVDGAFFHALLAVHEAQAQKAEQWIDRTRSLLSTKLAALVGESYTRAYGQVVLVQQLAELEEIVLYQQQPHRQAHWQQMWSDRLAGCQREIEVWHRVLAVRSLVMAPHHDLVSWLKFGALCRKCGRLAQAQHVLDRLLVEDPRSALLLYHQAKTWWAGSQSQQALALLQELVDREDWQDPGLEARCHRRLGQMLLETRTGAASAQALHHFERATQLDSGAAKNWNWWAAANYGWVTRSDQTEPEPFILAALTGLVQAIALEPSGSSLQNLLRLLNVWFLHGHRPEVEESLSKGLDVVPIDTWLLVIPQIIARIDTPHPRLQSLLQTLLCRVGRVHPQALIYPLTVASKSQSANRRASATRLLADMTQHSPVLVEQAQLVSQELIRVAILWHELWFEALEDASRLYFGQNRRDVAGMMARLAPLHALLDQGPQTLREVSFSQAYGRDLHEARDWCRKYQRSQNESDLNQAWELYCQVFRRINKQLPSFTDLELQYVSPRLLAARDLELAVPGTYRAGNPLVQIAYLSPSLHVIESKQRPRKLTIRGSDGHDFAFLLKGHEDLRQDERVMQLFGLVNSLFAAARSTQTRDLAITRYSAIPLAPNSGLIEWLPHCDTVHALIKDYREKRQILLNVEHRLMLQMAPDYQHLPLLHKVEVFQQALSQTTGQDLNQVLWLQSASSEIWLDRRTNYTRSLAVMSMVGYVLGLGDRHPCNLMQDRHTGKIIHIDFGDCFEVAMQREKYPEKIPFRLTRMLIRAMEVSGIEGNYRSICEQVLLVLRQHKESVMAVLEAFVYDPLINWRLLQNDGEQQQTKSASYATSDELSVGTSTSEPSQIEPGSERIESRHSTAPQQAELNSRAIVVMERVTNKLSGRDFAHDEVLDVPFQVQRLIQQATSHENLCQCYIGWSVPCHVILLNALLIRVFRCPFW